MNDSTAPSLGSHREIIDLWPSLTEFAADIGVSYNTAKHIRRRGSIPDAHRPATIAAAEKRGLPGVTFEVITRLASERRRAAS